MALPELTLWKAEAIRATFIANEPINPAPSDWWTSFTGEKPETIISKPNAGMQSISGQFNNGNLEMRVAFNRVDWLLTPAMAPIEGTPCLGKAEDAFSFLSMSLSAWINETKSIPFSRIAYAPIFTLLVSNLEEGNNVLSNYFNLTGIKERNVQDLFIQMNIPSNLDCCDNILFNRVGKFVSNATQIMNFGMDSPIPTIQEQYICHTEFDFNTDASRQIEIPANERFSILEKLSDSTIRLLSRGWE
ncbi:hypothetical protein ACK32K_11600 [Aeromonas dhakensis]|uniref:hypothetical protein n=1 Tax=Aeromonas dhakensis TaxID=196024 RepID=UPI0010081E13|nr:hypothetical protein [Aeromonas dhakensis]WAF71476.1 hypothetical protein NRK99_15895 [Aeromonas dhakensis]